jgi:hypothetical protein
MESTFLRNLIGKPVSITGKGEAARGLPPLVLREISVLGIVGEDCRGPRFLPWAEIAEVSPCHAEVPAGDLALSIFADSEL